MRYDSLQFPFKCFVGGGDLGINPEVRPFLREECVALRKTKKGLIEVCLLTDPTAGTAFVPWRCVRPSEVPVDRHAAFEPSQWTIEDAKGLLQYHGIDVESEMVKALTAEILKG